MTQWHGELWIIWNRSTLLGNQQTPFKLRFCLNRFGLESINTKSCPKQSQWPRVCLLFKVFWFMTLMKLALYLTERFAVPRFSGKLMNYLWLETRWGRAGVVGRPLEVFYSHSLYKFNKEMIMMVQNGSFICSVNQNLLSIISQKNSWCRISDFVLSLACFAFSSCKSGWMHAL